MAGARRAGRGADVTRRETAAASAERAVRLLEAGDRELDAEEER